MLFTDISSERAVKAFIKAGFWVALSHGAKHIGMTDGRRMLTIPRRSRINPYTLKGIIRSAGLTDEEFKELL
jgi:hypothetical protein